MTLPALPTLVTELVRLRCGASAAGGSQRDSCSRGSWGRGICEGRVAGGRGAEGMAKDVDVEEAVVEREGEGRKVG